MIIATAGHVDHGKTLLVKALTGVDADRLPEEKKRGMTIDLGFAYLPIQASPGQAPVETIGFIDVPGHERFIHNMLAGVAGIDFVLFIIAADDGPMPQTREHLSILDLLGIRNGAVAITKTDRVALARVREVQNEVAALFSRTTLADPAVFPVSAITGDGIDDLKAHLLSAAREWRPKTTAGNFRLAIDRSFTVSGAGLIVTGTAMSGCVSTGEQVRVLQAGFPVRARTIHAQNAASPTGRAGQRCAINLAGPELKSERIERGDWVVTGNVAEPVLRFDARLRVLESELRPLAHWTPVHVHLGASDVTGRIAVLQNSGNDAGIAPGTSGLVQFVLDRPVGALYGDGLIVRDQSAQRTLGGGRVIDIFPPARGRAKPERLAYLAAMENDDTPSAFSHLVHAVPRGLNLTRFAQNRNLTAREAAELITSTSTRPVPTTSGVLGFSTENWNRLKTAVVEALASLHRRAPNTIPGEDRVFQEAGLRLPKEVAAALAAELTKQGIIVREPSGIRLRTHVAQVSPADVALWKKTEPLLAGNPLQPPAVGNIASALGMDAKSTEAFLIRVSRMGLAVRIAPNRFSLPAALRRGATFVEEIAAANGGMVTAARLRDRAGIGRGMAIEILEYFDRIKFTRRIGDDHQLLRPAQEALGAEGGAG
jgi:selenocysteine-specific elongation factor